MVPDIRREFNKEMKDMSFSIRDATRTVPTVLEILAAIMIMRSENPIAIIELMKELRKDDDNRRM